MTEHVGEVLEIKKLMKMERKIALKFEHKALKSFGVTCHFGNLDQIILTTNMNLCKFINSTSFCPLGMVTKLQVTCIWTPASITHITHYIDRTIFKFANLSDLTYVSNNLF